MDTSQASSPGRDQAAPKRRQLGANPEQAQAEKGLGPAVEAFRLASGFSRQQLAERAGVTRNAIFKIETGERTPSPATLSKLCEALDIETEHLLSTAWQAASEEQAEDRRSPRPEIALITAAGLINPVGALTGAAIGALPTVLRAVASHRLRRRRALLMDEIIGLCEEVDEEALEQLVRDLCSLRDRLSAGLARET